MRGVARGLGGALLLLAATSAWAADRTGPEVYRAACQACHGPDGRGQPRSVVGFDVAVPDFSDCRFTTPEAEADWFAIVYNGGPVRAFDRRMPSFGGALSEPEIRAVVTHLRSFCAERARWPPGDLNFPRALVTEKAYPENEALLTLSASRRGDAAMTTTAIYERRIGSRWQWELMVPIEARHGSGGAGWRGGIGDIGAAVKHVLFHDPDRGSILAAGAELLAPTGRSEAGRGKGVAIVEPFVAAGQALPWDGFVQVQAGIELPVDRAKASREAFCRVAGGRTFFHNRFHREWSPMLELAAAKALAEGERTEWDVVPQVQLSLSRRHHVLVSGGLQIPVNRRASRGATFRMYLLWDWFDGPFTSGW
jgi:mono/diheme cytochrome c family protein